MILSKPYFIGTSNLLMTSISLKIRSTNRWKLGLAVGVRVSELENILIFLLLLLSIW